MDGPPRVEILGGQRKPAKAFVAQRSGGQADFLLSAVELSVPAAKPRRTRGAFNGARVKATRNGVTTVYLGNTYEQSGSITTTYYYAGGTRVAMRQGITVSYLLGDHLGSTAITANSSGGLSAELRYKPWGESRYANGTTPTRRQYTGQINDSEIGLYFYGARMYAPGIMRFISADMIVPQPENPQTLNRYSYGLNNPVKYIDPTGHCSEFNRNENYQDCLNLAEAIQSAYRVSVENYQTLEIWDITALTNLQGGLTKFRGAIGQNAFDKLFPGTSVTFKYDALLPAAHWEDGSITVAQANFELSDKMFQMTIVHELAHGLFERMPGGEDKVILREFVPVAGWAKFDLLTKMFASIGISIPPIWINPRNGPTEYARGEIEARRYVHPREDAADTFAALVVAGTADYPITPGRERWFNWLIAEVKK